MAASDDAAARAPEPEDLARICRSLNDLASQTLWPGTEPLAFGIRLTSYCPGGHVVGAAPGGAQTAEESMIDRLFAALAIALWLAPAAAQAQSSAGQPTFSKDVAPIFYAHCTSCHRPGEIAPMSLLTYADARPFARSIATQVSQGTMPPWHAEAAHGTFANDRRMSAAEKDTLLQWVASGAIEGAPVDLPSQPEYPDGWTIGQPDAVLSMAEDYPVPAAGTLDYKYFEVPTSFTEDKWIQAYEVKPGEPSVVHHLIVYARPPRRAPQPGAAPRPAAGPPPERPFTFAPGMGLPPEARARMAHEDVPNDRPVPQSGLGAFVGGFAPGQNVRIYQEGTAMRLPAGATLIFQMHYTANGTATTDRTTIAFRFADGPPRHEVLTISLVNQNFTLPAGVPDTRVDAQMTFNRDATVWSILPHTHVRGRAWEVEVTYPDGRSEIVLSVPNYDFNWQTDYVFSEPLKLPKGAVLRTSAWYDNSPANRSNPDPTADVFWGDQTWEEMQFTAMTVTLGERPSPTGGAADQP